MRFDCTFLQFFSIVQESPIKESEDDEDDSADESVIEPKATSKKSQVLSDSESEEEEKVSHFHNSIPLEQDF